MKLLDTSVVVDIDRGGIEEKVQKLDEQGRHLLSMVSVTELRLGVELQYEQGTDAYETAMDELVRPDEHVREHHEFIIPVLTRSSKAPRAVRIPA
ncbi:type II toxin-antitoxin system VapC family toxin [Halovenus halobia]|uniref:type II toxin-antitoxin system VapC family toxin n=1 Tax=Halovenus halobia TaxID=3396622 RepID=UPI003F57242A